MRLHSFHGGLRLTADKEQSLRNPIFRMPLPDCLFLPFDDGRGRRRQPVVSIGDVVNKGQVLAVCPADVSVPLLASASGVIESMTPASGLFLKTTNDLNTIPLRPDSDQDFTERLRSAAIVGLGGAAFPAADKLGSSKGYAPDTLIINAAECEPVIACDQALIREYAHDIIKGIAILTDKTSVTRCLIGLEDNMHNSQALLEQALVNFPDSRISIVPVPSLYPTGSERQLIHVLTGRKVPYQQLPREVGVVCFNVATALAVKRMIYDSSPLLNRVVTVAGTAIAKPCNVEVAFGTTVDGLIRFVEPELATENKGADGNRSPLEITVGGPMSGITLADNGINDAGANQGVASVSAATNCVIVNHAQPAKPSTPCIRCGYCDEVCPAELLPQQLHWYCRDGNHAAAAAFKLDACIECGCCDHVCPSGIALTAQFRTTKSSIQEEQHAQAFAEHAKRRFDNRQIRLQQREVIKQERLAARKKSKESIQATLNRSLANSRSKLKAKTSGTKKPEDNA